MTSTYAAFMGLTFPDLSHYRPGITLASDTPALIAKASQGVAEVDETWPGYRDQALRTGKLLAGYHFLDLSGSPEEQAVHALSVIGPHIPASVDVETPGVTPGMFFQFVRAYRKPRPNYPTGGILHLAYIPEEFWRDHWGAINLLPYTRGLGISLHNANYVSVGAGFRPYGNVTPRLLQFTDKAPYQGSHVDMNVFPGTIDQLREILYGESDLMEWTDQVVDNPHQRPDSPRHNPPGTNSEVRVSFALSDMYQRVYDLCDLAHETLAAVKAAATTPAPATVAGFLGSATPAPTVGVLDQADAPTATQ